MHELYFVPNGTILLYTMGIPPLELNEHVRYTNVGFRQHLRLGPFGRNLTIVTKGSILDISRVLDPNLHEPHGHLFCISDTA